MVPREAMPSTDEVREKGGASGRKAPEQVPSPAVDADACVEGGGGRERPGGQIAFIAVSMQPSVWSAY